MHAKMTILLYFAGAKKHMLKIICSRDTDSRFSNLKQAIPKISEMRTAQIINGIIWAVWHIPMWTIRNSLGFEDILPLMIWAVLISLIYWA